MSEIENNVLNRVPAEFRPLLNLDHLTNWTLDRQREHTADLSAYEAGRAVFQTVLRSQHIPGDRKWAARWRARKVEKHWNRLVKASRDSANASESLRIAYADHVRVVAALPAQRADKATAKEVRRGKVNDFTAKSLNKTVSNLAPQREGDEETETAGQARDSAAAGRTVRGVNDLFGRRGA
ncbi:hypothetical protein EES45_36315 [Streptomyces sp. ADI97-07]|uniref:hypothetical protein n=1 Tax=Streptomyces sp. ADI97-07 TaxID=1522762 RepID=UPI000F959C19|nr:hypothetical protein [Streptomyces sp. ADI97-07]RPK69987.1 hypothetical protein EES45_36315 [Streptomyces sp. ADI97-07]